MKSKNEEAIEVKIVTKIGNIESAANSGCPFILPQPKSQNNIIQFKSLAPKNANTSILISPRENFNMSDVHTILKETSETNATLVIKSSLITKYLFMPTLSTEILMVEVIK